MPRQAVPARLELAADSWLSPVPGLSAVPGLPNAKRVDGKQWIHQRVPQMPRMHGQPLLRAFRGDYDLQAMHPNAIFDGPIWRHGMPMLLRG